MEEILGENSIMYRVLFTWKDGLSRVFKFPANVRGIVRTIKNKSERPISVEFIDEIPNLHNSVESLKIYDKWKQHCEQAVDRDFTGEIYPTNAPKKKQQVAKQLEVNIVTEKAATDKVGTGLVLIPFYSLLALGKIFIEGLRYGRDNWKKGVHDKIYQEERLEHAILHLIKWKEGDRSEAHLSKVAWFCFTQLEIERLEQQDAFAAIKEKKEPKAQNGWKLIEQNLHSPKVKLNLERLRGIYLINCSLNDYQAIEILEKNGIPPFDILS